MLAGFAGLLVYRLRHKRLNDLVEFGARCAKVVAPALYKNFESYKQRKAEAEAAKIAAAREKREREDEARREEARAYAASPAGRAEAEARKLAAEQEQREARMSAGQHNASIVYKQAKIMFEGGRFHEAYAVAKNGLLIRIGRYPEEMSGLAGLAAEKIYNYGRGDGRLFYSWGAIQNALMDTFSGKPASRVNFSETITEMYPHLQAEYDDWYRRFEGARVNVPF